MGRTVCPCSGADKEIESFVPVAGSSGKKPNKQSVTGRCVNSNSLSLHLGAGQTLFHFDSKANLSSKSIRSLKRSLSTDSTPMGYSVV